MLNTGLLISQGFNLSLLGLLLFLLLIMGWYINMTFSRFYNVRLAAYIQINSLCPKISLSTFELYNPCALAGRYTDEMKSWGVEEVYTGA